VPLVLFVAGLLFLVAKQIWHDYEFSLLPFAVILIVCAHILNYRLSRPVTGTSGPGAAELAAK
jgi:hypothetical protein